MNLDEWLLDRLAEIEAQNLKRRLRTIESAQGPVVTMAGRPLVNFSSNDYLGLAADSRVIAASVAATERYGAGAGSARLICGNQSPHAALEEALARFKGTEAALAFSTGYAAAVGSIPALVGQNDVIILDKLCHASLVDGARLSGATIRVFPHNHLEKLERLLSWARENFAKSNVLVVTESVFSMDGDTAPLREIADLKDRHGAWLMVDEAHGTGVLGPKGRGLASNLGIAHRVDIQMGTLGKALGAAGGAICGSRALIDFLVNRARSFIFSTAPGAASAAAAIEAIRLLESGEAAPLIERLWFNLERFNPSKRPASAIVPHLVGDEAAAISRSERLREQGFLVPAVRYPTVARGQARLRITISAAHSPEQVDGLRTALCAMEGQEGS
jgi:glycine C-acetyltransferase/8-amino-7-oxononanoate synthase